MSRISKMVSDTEIRLQNPRVGLDLRGRPARDGPAPVEDHDVVAEVHHEVHVVLDDEKGPSFGVEVPDQVGDPLDQRRVDTARGLVEQDQRRLGHEHGGQLQQLLLAEGEVAGLGALQVVDADPGQPGPSPFHVGTVAETAEDLSQASAPKRDQHVVQHREPGEDAADLEGPAEPGVCDPVRGPGRDLASVDEHVAGVRADHPGDEIEERRLSRAVRADQAVDQGVLELDGDTVDGDDSAERLGEIVGMHDRHAPTPCRSRSSCCVSSRIDDETGPKRRSSAPTFGMMPSGMNNTTMPSSAPEKTMWICVSPNLVRKYSLAGATISAPTVGPNRCRTPPSRAIITMFAPTMIEKTKIGSRLPNHMPYRPPATPVKPAESANTATLYAVVGTPSASALSSSSRMAFSPAPNRERSMNHQVRVARSSSAAKRLKNNRWLLVRSRSSEIGGTRRPLEPPVSSRASCAIRLIIVTRAIETMTKDAPLTRTAARPTMTAKTTTPTVLITSARRCGRPRSMTISPVPYAPRPKNAACPSET